MRKDIHRIIEILAILLLLFPVRADAQWDFDIASVECKIDDHKRLKSIMLMRSTIEQANMLLHKKSSKTAVGYKELNAELDKYTRCFDLIDIIYTSGKTVFNARNTYDDVSEKLQGMMKLNETYVTKCLDRGNISVADSAVILIYARMVHHVRDDADQLIKSLYDLALYVTGAATCNTAGLMAILNSINDSMDGIRHSVDYCYHQLWKYITIRTTYWKEALYIARSRAEICDCAFGRWKQATYELYNGAVKTIAQLNIELGR